MTARGGSSVRKWLAWGDGTKIPVELPLGVVSGGHLSLIGFARLPMTERIAVTDLPLFSESGTVTVPSSVSHGVSRRPVPGLIQKHAVM